MVQGGDQLPKDGDSDPGCIVQRLILRPGEFPGLHQLVRVTGDGVGQARDIGIAAPRVIVKHLGHVLGGETAVLPDAGQEETAAPD